MAKTEELTIQDMNAQVKENSFGRLYLFYGEEEYLKDFYIEKIKQGLLGNDRFHFFRLDGRVEASELRQICDSIPMFGEKKVILVRNSGLFKTGKNKGTEQDGEGGKKNKRKDDFDFLNSLSESTCLIFREAEADKRSRLYKTVLSSGQVFSCVRQNASMIGKILQKYAKQQKRLLDPGAISLLILGVGDDLIRLLSEVEKLILLTEAGETIQEGHVRQVCTLSSSARIFDLTDGISENNREKAWEALEALLDAREPAPYILAMISRQFLQLYSAKQLLLSGCSQSELAQRMGVKDFVAHKLAQQCRHVTLDGLRERIDFCLRMDESVKNGTMKDRMALELIVTG